MARFARNTPFKLTHEADALHEPCVVASETGGQLIEFASAQEELPKQIKSVRRVVPIVTSQPLWSAPIALIAFVVLITLEWIGRKRAGLV